MITVFLDGSNPSNFFTSWSLVKVWCALVCFTQQSMALVLNNGMDSHRLCFHPTIDLPGLQAVRLHRNCHGDVMVLWSSHIKMYQAWPRSSKVFYVINKKCGQINPSRHPNHTCIYVFSKQFDRRYGTCEMSERPRHESRGCDSPCLAEHLPSQPLQTHRDSQLHKVKQLDFWYRLSPPAPPAFPTTFSSCIDQSFLHGGKRLYVIWSLRFILQTCYAWICLVPCCPNIQPPSGDEVLPRPKTASVKDSARPA